MREEIRWFGMVVAVVAMSAVMVVCGEGSAGDEGEASKSGRQSEDGSSGAGKGDCVPPGCDGVASSGSGVADAESGGRDVWETRRSMDGGGGSQADSAAPDAEAYVCELPPPPEDPTAEDDDRQPDLVPGDLCETKVRVDGTVYGASADARGPIGGGEGYANRVRRSEADHVVESAGELVEAVGAAERGDVIWIPNDETIDLTIRVRRDDLRLNVPGGVTLASGRGIDGAQGGMIVNEEFTTDYLFAVGGADVRFTGLRLRGPNMRIRDEELRRLEQEGGYYGFMESIGIAAWNKRGLEIDNCELFGWSKAAITLGNTACKPGIEGSRSCGSVQCGPDDAEQCAHIHHNHIHHNHRRGFGYGVEVISAVALVERNLFNYNRHSIAGAGLPGEGYEARHNVVGPHANKWGHAFDMHRCQIGGSCTVAGSWLDIHHNQFRLTHEEAVKIRGHIEGSAQIDHNWFFHAEPAPEVDVVDSCVNTTVENNVYGRNPSPAGEEGFDCPNCGSDVQCPH